MEIRSFALFLNDPGLCRSIDDGRLYDVGFKAHEISKEFQGSMFCCDEYASGVGAVEDRYVICLWD